MKTNKFFKIILPVLTLIVFTGCDDFLDTKSEDTISGENFYQNEEDFQAATTPLYNKVWFDFNDKFYYGLGDGRSYNLYAPFSDYIYPFSDLVESGLTGPLVSAWGSFYIVVQQSNNVINGITKSSVDENIKKKYIAEARFMRGLAYWHLASLWGNVIISTDPKELVDNPIVNTNPRKDVYEFAMRDLEYAAMYLPEEAVDVGRVTKYSAYAMLSRVYLAFSGLSDNPNSGSRNETYLEYAKKAAEVVIQKGPYSLMDNYYDLFKIENNNNPESIFALQWVPNGSWGLKNTQQAYFAWESSITNDGTAWGWWTRASYDVLKIYEKTDVRRYATWMGYGDYYPDIQKANGGYTCKNGTSYLNVKKGVVGSSADNPDISYMNSSLNTYMMRYAEVYLNYAEAVLGNSESTSDPVALGYFNSLRKRAKVDTKSSITFEDILKERRREFCMEGRYWYDLVAWSYFDQQAVVNYITAQNRGTITPIIYKTSTNTVTVDEEKDASSRAIGTIDASIFILPYPESEVIQNPLLDKNPVDYDFSEERLIEQLF